MLIFYALIVLFLELFEELFGARASSRVDRQLHVADLFVYLFHERDNKVDQLVPVHLLRVKVGYKKTDIVVLYCYYYKYKNKEKN